MVSDVTRTTAVTCKKDNTSVYQTSSSDESCVATAVHDPPDKSVDCVNLDQSSVQDITIGLFGTTVQPWTSQ